MRIAPLTKNTRSVGLVMLLLAGSATAFGSAAGPAHEHGHAPHGPDALESPPPPGARWETDPTLEQGMNRIRAALAGALPAWRAGTFDRTQAHALATAVADNVAFMVANCKLAPAADAALHLLLADLQRGAAVLHEAPASPEGVPRMVAALRRYPQHFAHHGWEPLPGP